MNGFDPWRVVLFLPSLMTVATIGFGTLAALLFAATGRSGARYVAVAGVGALVVDLSLNCLWEVVLRWPDGVDFDSWPMLALQTFTSVVSVGAWCAVAVSALLPLDGSGGSEDG